jgi:hypothetical protein
MKKTAICLVLFMCFASIGLFAQQQISYKIGDTGPGGGIIFSVEGNSFVEVSRLLGDFNYDDAIRTAENFRGGNFSDWYLPSLGELNLIYQNLQKNGIVNLGAVSYWSSSPSQQGHPSVVFFQFEGTNGNGLRHHTHSVRAVRIGNITSSTEVSNQPAPTTPAVTTPQISRWEVIIISDMHTPFGPQRGRENITVEATSRQEAERLGKERWHEMMRGSRERMELIRVESVRQLN